MEKNTEFNQRELLVRVLSGFPEILTNEDIHKITDWSFHTINKYASDGKFPNPLPKLGRFKRYSKDEFIDFWVTRDQYHSDITIPNKVGRPTKVEALKNSRS